MLGPLGVAPPSEPGDAGHRATPQGALGEALNEPLKALSEASPVEALVVVEPMATPPICASGLARSGGWICPVSVTA